MDHPSWHPGTVGETEDKRKLSIWKDRRSQGCVQGKVGSIFAPENLDRVYAHARTHTLPSLVLPSFKFLAR